MFTAELFKIVDLMVLSPNDHPERPSLFFPEDEVL